jgi:hypothetical protein
MYAALILTSHGGVFSSPIIHKSHSHLSWRSVTLTYHGCHTLPCVVTYHGCHTLPCVVNYHGCHTLPCVVTYHGCHTLSMRSYLSWMSHSSMRSYLSWMSHSSMRSYVRDEVNPAGTMEVLRTCCTEPDCVMAFPCGPSLLAVPV